MEWVRQWAAGAAQARTRYGYETEREGRTPMLKALRKRVEQDEEGFTLIELMVVVLIIAILMAIAIPTFLSAKNSAQDSAAQQNIANSLTESLAYFTSNQNFGVATTSTALEASLVSSEPNITFATQATLAAPSTINTVYVFVGQSNTTSFDDYTVLSGKSSSGKCFFAYTDQTSGSASLVGTYYDSAGTACTVPTAMPKAANSAQGSSASNQAGTAANIWGSAW